MPFNVTVRLADFSDPDDSAAILRLLDEYSLGPMGLGRPFEPAVRERIVPGLAAHPTSFALFAFRQQLAVGLAVCFEGYSTFLAKPLVNIHDLVVSEACRGQGIGRQLLAAVEQEARRRGAGRVTLEVRADNEIALPLYRRVGFRDPGALTYFLTLPIEECEPKTPR